MNIVAMWWQVAVGVGVGAVIGWLAAGRYLWRKRALRAGELNDSLGKAFAQVMEKTGPWRVVRPVEPENQKS